MEPGTAAPAASAPSAPSGAGAPSSGSTPQGAPSASMNTGNATPKRPAGEGAPAPGQRAEKKPDAREPIKVKHKHALEDGSELELELDIADHVAAYKRKMKSAGEEREV